MSFRSGDRLRLAAMLAPVLLIVAGLFAGGLGIAFAQSIGSFGAINSEGPTLQHYAGVFSDREFYASLVLTMWVATASTCVSVAGGVTIALLLQRFTRGRRAAYALLQVPLAIPHLAMAIALIALAAPSGWVARVAYALGWIAGSSEFPSLVYDRYGFGIILAYVAKEIPFIAVVATALLLRIGEDYDSVARTLGASAWQRFRHVTLPLIAPGVFAAALIIFAFVFAAFETPFILGRPFPSMLSVVAQRRYLSLDLADRPGAIAFALIMTALAALVVRAYLAVSHAVVGRDRPMVF